MVFVIVTTFVSMLLVIVSQAVVVFSAHKILNVKFTFYDLLKYITTHEFWGNTMGILFILFLTPVLFLNTRTAYFFSTVIVLCYFYLRPTRLAIKVGSEVIILKHPITWYTKDYFEITFKYFKEFNLVNRTKKVAKELWEIIKETYYSDMNYLRLALGLQEPADTEYKDVYDEQYRFQKTFFKYKKPQYPKRPKFTGTKEELEELIRRIDMNRDPTIMFNSVSRLPWFFDYDISPNPILKLVKQHTLVFYNFFKTTIVAIFLMLLYFIYTVFFFKLQFLKQLSVWFVIGMLYFWLMSGFNFFLKRYQFSKFTSAIQRFWKRTNICFWLIEGFLMLLFFYYYLNSSQEPLYMYDYSSLNQEYLVSLHTAGTNIILLSLVIYFMYFTLLRINSNGWSQINLYLIVISLFIFFSFFIETYQFYYVISTFNERVWSFNEEENLWSMETDSPILRTKHQYLLICLIAKYWHFLFIFLSWVFFLIKSFERKKITYTLFGANLQNVIILYVLNFACYIQWFKWLYRRFFDLPYTWFMTSIDTKIIFRLFNEVKLLMVSMSTNNFTLLKHNSIIYKSLNIWTVDTLAMWKYI